MSGPTDIVSPFRIFFAADPNSPESTLVAFEGVTAIKVAAQGYESLVVYRVRPAENTKTVELEGFSILPIWPGALERLVGFYRKSGNEMSMPLKSSLEPTRINFSVSGSSTWSFHELEYQIRDNRGNAAASLYVPVFVPAP